MIEKKTERPRRRPTPKGFSRADPGPPAAGDAAPASAARACLAVVGVGASAGGLEAFKQFFAAMPPDSGMVFVLIQHLDPTHQSLTAELLGKHTAMPVVEVEDAMRVEPNRVYVIPPNAYLTMSGETLHLSEPAERRGLRMPIDFFFRSLADDQQERAIGIILSGSGTDGTLGVREIKAAGGMVMVQTPETTGFDGMPRSAIGTGMVDYVSPIEKMPEVLSRYVRHWYVNGAVPSPPVVEKAPDNLHAIIGLLRAHVRYDFSCYKKGTLTRRVQRRMGLTHIEKMGEYVQFLRQNKEEVNALYKDLLISVTNFFREPEAWEALARQVIAPLVREHDNETPVRVWVPGCATGEEAYSLVILLSEELQAADKACGLQIFASDIDLDALAFARAGTYPENIAADISPERLRHFFIKGEHTYRINKEIREAVVFAEQHVVSDPPFSKLDLISCRNLLIYLEVEVQQKILSLFHFALREGGYLFLGGSETVSQRNGLFQAVSRKRRIYERIGPVGYTKVELPAKGADTPPLVAEARVAAVERRAQRLSVVAQQLVLQRFAPACVLVNRKVEVLYLNGPVDHYLQLPSGELGADLIAMARPGLRTRLRTAVREAIQADKAVAVGGVRIKRNGEYFAVRVAVEPLRHPPEAQGFLLVAFDEEDGDHRPRLAHLEPPEPPREEPETGADYEAIIHQLEEELRTTREDLQSTVEELDTSNEEFMASNEEVTSVNEELQSTNEELETSKEELQSLNEELQTVNNQLEQKVAELEATNNDLNNLLVSTDIPTVFLDRHFCLKRFTPATKRLVRVIETDAGRPIRDFALSFTDPELLADAERVLQQLAPIEREVDATDGRYYLRRILPYRTGDDRIVGVVITFDDITSRKGHERALERLAEELDERVRERTAELEAANAALRESEQRFRTMADSAPVMIWISGPDKGCTYFNKPWLDFRGRSMEEELGDGWAERLHPDDRQRCLDTYFTAFDARLPFEMEYRLRRHDGEYRWVLDTGVPRTVSRGFEGFIGSCVDITERKRMERSIAELAEEERQRLGRELHDTLGQQMSAIGMLAAALASELPTGTPAADQAARLESTVDQAKAQLAAVFRGLFPVHVDAQGLRLALEGLAQEMTELHQIPYRFEVEGHAEVENNFAATQLYLIAREAAHNAARHAGADEIVIRVEEHDGVQVSVRDNGVGIRPKAAKERRGFGMDIMRHRCALAGGILQIESPPDGGMLVYCYLPKGAGDGAR